MRLIQQGPRNARIVAVGEAPGKNEAFSGVPFSGGAGEQLNRSLSAKHVDLLRSEIFITNICHVQPPGNDFDWFVKPQMRQEFVEGVMQLQADLTEIKPNVVLALGAWPLKILTGKVGIGKWRGSILPCTLVPGLKVVASYHPASVMRMYSQHAVLEFDLARVKEESKSPDLDLPQRQYIIDPPADIRWMVANEMARAEWLSIDIEAFERDDGGWEPFTIAFSDPPYSRALVLQIKTAEDWMLIRYLCECEAKKILQNGWGFDEPTLAEYGIKIKNFVWDTMLAMHSRFPECASSDDELNNKKTVNPIRKGLAFISSICTREPQYKEDGKIWKRTNDIGMLLRYNGTDAIVTGESQPVQEKWLTEFGTLNVFKHEMRLTRPLQVMMKRGIKIDVKLKESEKLRIENEIANLQNFLDTGAGKPINVKSTHASGDMRWLLYEKLGLPVQKNRETHQPTTNKEAIAHLASKHSNPLLMTVVEIRERRDFIERYLDVSLDEDNRWRSAFDITGTNTGRLSSRKSNRGTGNNLFNIPAELRRMFIADDGMATFEIDFSQAEARDVAWMSRAEGLIDMFSNKRDVYRETAAGAYRIAIGDVTPEQRYTFKRVILASNYGLQVEHLVALVNTDYRETGMRITYEEGQFAQNAYFMLNPEIKENYWKETQNQLRRTRTLVAPELSYDGLTFQRKREFFDRWGEPLFTSAYAFAPQSHVGDLGNIALVLIQQMIDRGELNCEMWLSLYDAVVGQAPVADVVSVVEKIRTRAMNIATQIQGRELVIPTEASVGYNWGKRIINKDGTVDNPNGLRPLKDWINEQQAATRLD